MSSLPNSSADACLQRIACSNTKATADTRAVWGSGSGEVRTGSPFSLNLVGYIYVACHQFSLMLSYYRPSQHRNGFQEYCYPPLWGSPSVMTWTFKHWRSSCITGHEWVRWPQQHGRVESRGETSSCRDASSMHHGMYGHVLAWLTHLV